LAVARWIDSKSGGALPILAILLDFPSGQPGRDSENEKMSDDVKCKYCFGTGQKVEMTPAKWGEKLAPYKPCLSCGGTGVPPKPAKGMENVSIIDEKGRVFSTHEFSLVDDD
jgi:hypothetical protein